MRCNLPEVEVRFILEQDVLQTLSDVFVYVEHAYLCLSFLL